MTTTERPFITPGDGLSRLRRWRDAASLHLNRWFGTFDAILADNRAWVGAIAFVLVLQIVLTTQHGAWLDEWQALQLAAQSPRLPDLMANLRYEGHPALWYLILRGFSALFSDQTRALPAAALIIAIPVQLTILLAAPFSRIERLMLSLSEFVLIEYCTISRSLTLGIAVLFAVAALWKRPRLVWLPIAILPQCDFLFGVVSVLLVGLRLRDRRADWPLAALWFASGLFAAWSVRPAPDIVPALLPQGPLYEGRVWLAGMSTLGLPLQWRDILPEWNQPPPMLLRSPALAGFFAVAWIELRRNRDLAMAFGLFVAVLLVFDLTVYELSIRHLTIAAALLIVFVWRVSADGAPRSVWWRAWLLVIAACGLFTAAINLIVPFDTAPEAGALIARMGLRDKTWVSFPRSVGQGIAAADGITMERLGEHCSEDFIRWNVPDDHLVTTKAMVNARLHRKLQQDGRYYVISWYNLPIPDPAFMRRIGKVGPGYNGLAYNLYVVGENHPAARLHGQPCNGPHPKLQR